MLSRSRGAHEREREIIYENDGNVAPACRAVETSAFSTTPRADCRSSGGCLSSGTWRPSLFASCPLSSSCIFVPSSSQIRQTSLTQAAPISPFLISVDLHPTSAMYSRRLVSRLSSLGTSNLTRPLSTSVIAAAPKRAPSLSDVEPNKGQLFDQKSQQFRDDLAAAQRKREQEESQSIHTPPSIFHSNYESC